MRRAETRFDSLFSAAQRHATDGGRLRVDGVDIARLSRLFGAERSERRSDYMADPKLRAAYLSFFLPQYAQKIALLLAQLEREGLCALPDAPRVLDIGAGPLSATLGVWLHKGALGRSVALDLAAKAMHAGKAILDAVDASAPVRLAQAPVAQRPLPQGPFDVVIVAHVLNELGDPRRAIAQRTSLLRALAGVLAPGGRVLVVEPGTRVHGRALMAVRDELWNDPKNARVLSPCRSAPACPLLRRPGDWCHGEVAWDRPDAFRALEDAAGLKKDLLKSSHLLLGRTDDADAPRTGLRLIGGLMRGDDGVERRYGCGRNGLVVLRGAPRLPEPARAPLRGELLADERGIDVEHSVPRPGTRTPPHRGTGRPQRRRR